MRTKNFTLVLFLSLTFSFIWFSADARPPRPEDKLPTIAILATGGTIAGSAESGTQAGYSSGQVGVEILIDAVPELKKLANIIGEQIANVGSQNMSDDVWLKLAKRINELLSKNDVDGVVITHGTDTMEETAFFLNMVIKSKKPVVLTGSMRPSTAMSADGPLNIYNAVAVAADPESVGKGVMVVANDQIHSARDITKTSTTAVETFKSPLKGILGNVAYGTVYYYRNTIKPHTADTEFKIDNDLNALPRVDIIFVHEDIPGYLIDASVETGAKGIVTAGVGNGNLTDAAVEALDRAREAGVLVVRASRVPTGIVERNIELNDDELEFIASLDFSPQKARILLRLALMQTNNWEEIQDMFAKY